jgi:hypothetical protein
MNDDTQVTTRPDPWAPWRSQIESLTESCVDYLGRITRSLAQGTDAHYVTEKAHALRDAAALLTQACHEATLDARRCGAEIERVFDGGEVVVDECTLPRGHRGPHSPRRPATPVERAADEASELAEHARTVADRLAWYTGPAGYDRRDDVDELERELLHVGWALESTRSAVAALRTGQATGDVR